MTQNNISVSTQTQYIAEQSNPELAQYLFAYTITITNSGTQNAQLINRSWEITDANNEVQSVFGAGVVGEQPHLKPGDIFEYTSSAMLPTPLGCMQGYYEMQTDAGELFKAEVAVFSLAVPNILN